MYSIDEGLASIKECLDPGAPEPGSHITEMGLNAIRECLYSNAPEPSEMSLEEACKIVADWMYESDDQFVSEAMSNINSILGREINESADLANVLLEGAQAFNEGLINFKIDSIDALKKAINIIDLTPSTSKWLVGIVKVSCWLYALCVIGIAGATVPSLWAATTSIAGALGVLGVATLVFSGALFFGSAILNWVITAVFNKLTGSDELPVGEVDHAVDTIIDEMVLLENKLKKAKKLEEVKKLHALKDDIFKRWGIYQKQQEEAAARAARHGAIVGGAIGGFIGSK